MRFPEKSEFLLGHEPIGRRPNVARELERIRKDPLESLLKELAHDDAHIVSNDFTRYQEAYWFYSLSLDRYLSEMSIAARFSRGPTGVCRSGGTQRYTSAERKLADEHKRTGRFLEYDLVDCLIHSRILMDRTIALSRHFLTGHTLPSFTSFSEHRKFFAKLSTPFGDHEEYARFIRQHTNWFEMPLKFVRDKFVVHGAPKHMRFLGYPMGGFELDLNIMLPDAMDSERPFSRVKVIRVNALRLSYDIGEFLSWYNDYGIRSINEKGT